VIAVGDCWPANRHHVVAARAPIAHLITGERVIPGDRGYRGIDTITSPARDNTAHITCDDHYQKHRRILARVEHTSSPGSKTQCHRRGQATNHTLHIITGLWNIKTTATQAI
jgi:hypothetical protein